MGSCCCSSRNPQLNGTSVYYYYPSILEDQESLASPDSVTTILDRGLMVDLDLNMSTPDTYRSPPAPIPYDVVLGHPQATYPETLRENINETDYRNSPTCRKFEDSDYGIEKDNVIVSPKKLSELLKLDDLDVKTMEEEDVCPTCLEEYHAENPKIITKCNHHYHLSCILEWMERSDTCPICNQVRFVGNRYASILKWFSRLPNTSNRYYIIALSKHKLNKWKIAKAWGNL